MSFLCGAGALARDYGEEDVPLLRSPRKLGSRSKISGRNYSQG
ncbi:MAG TPA: hypothetical protein VGR48_16170 [Terriglobales bacterium]|nr:hypothetical protein [Terriglobales bacterium]